jgi:ATP-dependent Lon protease
LTDKNLRDYLGSRRYFSEVVDRCKGRPGVVVGLAWTSVGGEILFIEATTMPGKGLLQLTGKLGDVMTESARIAHSLVRSRAHQFQIPLSMFQQKDIHLHVPAGAVPKDGPSAGVAMICALVSLLWKGVGKPAKERIAMTGEITLSGGVLPVGGLKEKVVAAKRAGVKTVVLPSKNRPDILEIPRQSVRGLKFTYVDDIDEALAAVIGPIAPATASGSPKTAAKKRTTKAAAKKRTTKAAAKKRTTKAVAKKRTTKATPKKRTVKAAAKKRTVKAAAKKRTTKAAAKKRTTKAAPKKRTVKAAAKKPRKKTKRRK